MGKKSFQKCPRQDLNSYYLQFLVQKSNALPTAPKLTQFNGCFSLRQCILPTCVDELSHVQTFINKLCDPHRHSFHFEQVQFQSVLTQLSYQRAKKCRQMDRHTDSFSVLLQYTNKGTSCPIVQVHACPYLPRLLCFLSLSLYTPSH